jgi:hypothetical protein
MTQNQDHEVAQTILQQLGGHRFVAMTGAKNLCTDGPALNFALPRGAKDGINAVKVLYCQGSDTYTVRFARLGRAPSYTFTVIRELEGVYADQLRSIFEQATGLYTSL